MCGTGNLLLFHSVLSASAILLRMVWSTPIIAQRAKSYWMLSTRVHVVRFPDLRWLLICGNTGRTRRDALQISWLGQCCFKLA
jgi:hypothetical protein